MRSATAARSDEPRRIVKTVRRIVARAKQARHDSIGLLAAFRAPASTFPSGFCGHWYLHQRCAVAWGMGVLRKGVKQKNAQNYDLTQNAARAYMVSMDNKTLMQNLEARAFEQRVTLNSLCIKAGVSPTILTRWRKAKQPPRVDTIGKLELALEELRGAA